MFHKDKKLDKDIENHLEKNKQKYTNYDFGKNWEQITPYLEEFLDNLIDEYQKENYEISKEFINKNRSPAEEFTESDAYHTGINEIGNEIIDKKDKSIFFRKIVKDPDCNMLFKTYDHYVSKVDLNDNTYDDVSNDISSKIFDLILFACGYDFYYNKTFILYWIPFGNCFNWNFKFGLYMAKKLFPNEKWILVETNYHTSVITVDTFRMFDILLWGCDGRLWNYLINESYYNDESLGALESIDMLLK